jgi:hypothetical protein
MFLLNWFVSSRQIHTIMLIELLKVDLEFAIESVGRFAFRLPSDHAGGYEFIIFFVNYCFDRVIVGVISLLIPDILIYSLFVSIFFPTCSSNRPIIYVANWTFQCSEVVLLLYVVCYFFVFRCDLHVFLYKVYLIHCFFVCFYLLAVRMDNFAGGLYSDLLRIRARTSRAV